MFICNDGYISAMMVISRLDACNDGYILAMFSGLMIITAGLKKIAGWI